MDTASSREPWSLWGWGNTKIILWWTLCLHSEFSNNRVYCPFTDPNLSQEAREKNMNEMNFDSQRLTAFLQSASQVQSLNTHTQSLKNFTVLYFLHEDFLCLLHFTDACCALWLIQGHGCPVGRGSSWEKFPEEAEKSNRHTFFQRWKFTDQH